MAAEDGEDWKHFADVFRAEVRRLGYEKRRQFVEASGLSTNTVAKLYRGEYVGPTVLVAVDEHLLWEAGSSERVLLRKPPIRRPAPTDDHAVLRRKVPTRRPAPMDDHALEVEPLTTPPTRGQGFVEELRRLRGRSRDEQAFIATVLLLVGDVPATESDALDSPNR